MNVNEAPRFYQALASLAVMFSDPMEEARQELYWEVLREQCTIAEWEEACMRALARETFHKVPLPAVLLGYVATSRLEQQRLIEREAARQREVARLQAQAERLALQASPEWQAAQAKQQAEEAEKQQEYAAWLAEQPRDVLVALGKLNPPDPSRWLPLVEEDGRPSRGTGGGLRPLIETSEENPYAD